MNLEIHITNEGKLTNAKCFDVSYYHINFDDCTVCFDYNGITNIYKYDYLEELSNSILFHNSLELVSTVDLSEEMRVLENQKEQIQSMINEQEELIMRMRLLENKTEIRTEE